MKNLKNNVNQNGEYGTEKQKMEDRLKVIEKGDFCRLLMNLLIREMGLEAGKIPMNVFNDTYAEIQKEADKAHRELRAMKDLGINGITGEVEEKPQWVEEFEKQKKEVGF